MSGWQRPWTRVRGKYAAKFDHWPPRAPSLNRPGGPSGAGMPPGNACFLPWVTAARAARRGSRNGEGGLGGGLARWPSAAPVRPDRAAGEHRLCSPSSRDHRPHSRTGITTYEFQPVIQPSSHEESDCYHPSMTVRGGGCCGSEVPHPESVRLPHLRHPGCWSFSDAVAEPPGGR
jgi:hypothetical protein